MPSGYEKSPDYGGPDPSGTDWGFVLVVVAVVVLFVLLFL